MKTEIRNPKVEIRRKVEIRNSKFGKPPQTLQRREFTKPEGLQFGISDFRFRFSDFFRPSTFGFRISP